MLANPANEIPDRTLIRFTYNPSKYSSANQRLRKPSECIFALSDYAMTTEHTTAQPPAHGWSAVLAMSVAAFALVASEFLPVSLLTPIAADLHISEGQAGQAIAVSGAFAVITSLSIAKLARQMDRRVLLLWLTLLMVVSGTLVAVAPGYPVFMLGRALIGVAIGGFWSMSAATVIRLVSPANVPRALAILNGGNALASVVAAPVGSYLGAIIGWRGAFFAVVPLAAITFVWQWLTLPRLVPLAGANARGLLTVLKRPEVLSGMLAVSLFFMGQFTLFTYLRPFLESVTHVSASGLSLMLLVLGVCGFIGTALIGLLLTRTLFPTLVVIPLMMAVIAVVLTRFGDSQWLTAGLLALWGLVATSAPVAWWTWLARTLPDDAEAGGGLMVAIVQLAITFGATAGGLLYDAEGYQGTFGLSAGLLLVAAVLAVWAAACSRGRFRGAGQAIG